jgi:hypothetical protein
MRRYFLPDSLMEYAPIKWFRKDLITWVICFWFLGSIMGTVFGGWWFYKVNYKPLHTKYTELQTQYRKDYSPPKPEIKSMKGK